MFSRIFGSLDRTYLIRAYCVGALYFALFLFMENNIGWSSNGLWNRIIPGVICLILFPFSKLVYDELKRFVFGDNVFYINTWVMLVGKIIINLVLFVMAWIIAPVGIAYIWFKTRGH